ncbi:MAG: hypothetical protein V4510_09545 [bacterium]
MDAQRPKHGHGLWFTIVGILLMVIGTWAFQQGAIQNSTGTTLCVDTFHYCQVQMSTAGTSMQLAALFAFLGSGILLTLGVVSFVPQWQPLGGADSARRPHP